MLYVFHMEPFLAGLFHTCVGKGLEDLTQADHYGSINNAMNADDEKIYYCLDKCSGTTEGPYNLEDLRARYAQDFLGTVSLVVSSTRALRWCSLAELLEQGDLALAEPRIHKRGGFWAWMKAKIRGGDAR